MSSAKGAPEGNDNAHKGAQWRSSLRRALARASAKAGDERPSWRGGLDRVADRLVAAALDGERWAIEEIGLREDGRPHQAVTIAGDADNPLTFRDFRVVRPEPKDDGSSD